MPVLWILNAVSLSTLNFASRICSMPAVLQLAKAVLCTGYFGTFDRFDPSCFTRRLGVDFAGVGHVQRVPDLVEERL
jgi:hypothetical protein